MPRSPSLNSGIHRRDFLNGLAVTSVVPWAAPLAGCGQSDPHGIREVGRRWGGNPETVYHVGHAVRDGAFRSVRNAADGGEAYDVVIVGAGLSGLASALYLQREKGNTLKILLLDNHSTFGGAAKPDLFRIGDDQLWAAQGSVVAQIPAAAPESQSEATALLRSVVPDLDAFLVTGADGGFGFVRPQAEGAGLRFFKRFEDAPVADGVREAYLEFLQMSAAMLAEGEWERRFRALDEHTFKSFLQSRGGSPGLYDWMIPELSSFFGIPDQVSAAAVVRHYGGGPPRMWALPGGNSAFARGMVMALMEDPGSDRERPLPLTVYHPGVAEMDRAGSATRIRLRATVVSVRQTGAGTSAQVDYVHAGRLLRVHGRSVIMAGGGFMTQHVVEDLSPEKRQAFASFIYAPISWVNVVVRDDRPLHHAGLPFLTMMAGTRSTLLMRYDAAQTRSGPSDLDLGSPTVLGLSIPFSYPGEPAHVQAKQGRFELIDLPFATFEAWISRDLETVLGPFGFDPATDISAISVCRWGHGYIYPAPGFLTSGARNVARAVEGRVAFANSDLDGYSHVHGAVAEGCRAAQDVLAFL